MSAPARVEYDGRLAQLLERSRYSEGTYACAEVLAFRRRGRKAGRRGELALELNAETVRVLRAATFNLRNLPDPLVRRARVGQ